MSKEYFKINLLLKCKIVIDFYKFQVNCHDFSNDDEKKAGRAGN